MAQYTSAGVYTNEIDLTTIISNVSTSIAAFAGYFSWGPLGEVTLVSKEKELVSRFGKPTNKNAESWFAAANILNYSNKEYIVRAGNTTSFDYGVTSAVANTNTLSNNVLLESIVKNEDDYNKRISGFDQDVIYVARYPGLPGNSLRISVCDTVEGYSSSVNLSSNTANGQAILVTGDTSSRYIFTPVGGAAIGTVTSFVNDVVSNLSIGDYISVGNTTISVQNLQIEKISNISSNTSAVYFDVDYVSPYRLRANTTLTQIDRKWEFCNIVTSAPGVSSFNKKYGSNETDEIHIVIIDEGGSFTNVPGTILEVYKGLSRATDAVADNNQTIYYANVLNTKSDYVWYANDRPGAESNVAANITEATTYETPIFNIRFNSAIDNTDESSLNLSDRYEAWESFNNETLEIDLLICGKSIGGIAGEQLPNFIIDNICDIRKDCIPFVSLPMETVVNNSGRELLDASRFKGLLRDTSFLFVDSGYKYQEDRYNGVYRWIPLCGDIAGLAARTDANKDSWWSFAGFNRGQIKNCIKLAWSPNQSQRDIIYPLGINPVVTFTGQGTFLYGDRTGQSKSSAFDRINVRRLFITLERAISKAAKYYLFEFNDAFTRASFKNMVNPYLKDIQGRRGITDFIVVCDETNNTGQVIDRNEFIGDIYIKPNRSINWITLNFVAVGTDVAFTSVIGNF